MKRDIISSVAALYWKMRWKKQISEMKMIGKNSKVGKGFSVIGSENISIGNDFAAGRQLYLQTWKN